jgi:hypothetical protein
MEGATDQGWWNSKTCEKKANYIFAAVLVALLVLSFMATFIQSGSIFVAFGGAFASVFITVLLWSPLLIFLGAKKVSCSS